MFTLLGSSRRLCDGHSRRQFLQLGGLAVGGLSLPALLHAEERAGLGQSNKSVIMVYLTGGLSHQDTFDLKPNAPDGVRSEFASIETVVPGIRISELLPMTAGIVDKLAVIRSIVGQRDEHASFQSLTGYPRGESLRDGRPNFGSVISQLKNVSSSATPPFVDLFPTMRHRPYNSPGPGVLGPSYRAVTADGEQLASMKLRYVAHDRLTARRGLLDQLDADHRETPAVADPAMQNAYEKAFDVLSSSKLVEALDVEREDPKLRDRYGRGSSQHLGDGAPMWNDQLLMARRLVEAGVRCVTVAYGFWDTHGNNFPHLRKHLPLFDRGISALIEDVYNRGLDEDVTVVVWGEFGRTPKINKDAGRDHWRHVNQALLAGGGLRVGQTIGTTDGLASSVIDRPVHYRDVLATIYHNLGIDSENAITDITGRRLPILPPGTKPIGELI